jgi:hypothetical protein
MTPYLNFLASNLPTSSSYDKYRSVLSETKRKDEVVAVINSLSKSQFEYLEKITGESVWSKEFKDLFTVDTLISCFYEDESHDLSDISYIVYYYLQQRKYGRSCQLTLNIIDSWKKDDSYPIENVIDTLCGPAMFNLKLTRTLLFNCHLFTKTKYGNYFLFNLYRILMEVEKGHIQLLSHIVKNSNDRSKLLFMITINLHRNKKLNFARHFNALMPKNSEEEIERKNDLERLLSDPDTEEKTTALSIHFRDPQCTFRLSESLKII